MKDYRAATWAVVATTLMVLTAANVIPATTAILSLAAGCSALTFLHALLRPRTETVEIQVGALNLASVGPTGPSNPSIEALLRMYGGNDADHNPREAGGPGCPVHGFSCPNSG